MATHLEGAEWKQQGNRTALNPQEPIKYTEVVLKTKDGKTIDFSVTKNGVISEIPNATPIRLPHEWNGKKLDEVLGKGLADKIMEKETGTLSGEGLKFGGEWANTLYDKQVGNIVKDLTGANIEKMDMGLPIAKDGAKTTQQGIKITPEIRAKILGEAPEIKKPSGASPFKEEPKKANLPKEKPIEEKKPTPINTDSFKSRVYERMKADNPELTGDVNVNRTNMKEDVSRAVDLIEKDKQKAYSIAMGDEVSSSVTSTSVNIALAEKALAEKDYALYARLVKNRSLEQTRRGVELVAEKGSITDNSTSRYVKELIATRLSKLGDTYLKGIKRQKTNISDIIKKETSNLKSKLSSKEFDIKEAQSFLDKLSC